MTPEEMEAKRERQRKLLYISIPALAVGIGAMISVLASMI